MGRHAGGACSLRQWACQTAASPDRLAALIAEITHAQPSTLGSDTRLDRDLNLDSLARVQLQSELEQRLGVSIGDEEFERIATLGELLPGLLRIAPRSEPTPIHKALRPHAHTAGNDAAQPQPPGAPIPSRARPAIAIRNGPGGRRCRRCVGLSGGRDAPAGLVSRALPRSAAR